MKKTIFYITTLSICAFIFTHAEGVMHYTKQALTLCYEIIIPSLFPFFVCSGILLYSGFAQTLAKYTEGIMRPLFNVAPTGAAAFVLGIISGFPLGAVCAKDLYKSGNLSKTEAERLLSFCNNSGPLFIIGTVGTAIYCSPTYGVILYAIHILSSVTVGLIFRHYGRSKHNSPPTRINTTEIPITQSISEALSSASRSIISVCFSIVFFSSVTQAMLDTLHLPPLFNALVSGICEFSSGVMKISELDIALTAKLVLTSFIVGFSGLCVHLQVMSSVASSGLSLKPYITGKLLHGTIASALTAAVIYLAKLTPTPSLAPLSMSFFAVSIILMVIVTLIIILGRKKSGTSETAVPYNVG